jgi:uncharacterized protein (DUF2225 family)
MSNESPFFLTKVECPICKTLNEFETIKVGAYVENGRDTDFCPLEIQWRFHRYQAYHPLVYFTATCSNCFYTREFTNNYKEWKNDNNFRTYRLKTIKAKHLDQLATADSVIKRMGEAIDIGRYPNESAILKSHLAVMDESMSDHPSKLDLGRFYLRIAWIFRSLQQGGNANNQFLNGLMLELDSKYLTLDRTFHEVSDELTRFTAHLMSHFDNDDVSTDIKARILPFKEQFEAALQEFNTGHADGEQKLQEILSLIGDYKATALGTDGTDGTAAFGSYPSFLDFLLQLKKDNAGITLNEREAMEKAIKFYIEALQDGRTIAPGNQQLQATYLIAELSRRIGDYDGAKQYFNATIKYGQEFIYQNRQDQSRTALARKILELAIEQGKTNLAALQTA